MSLSTVGVREADDRTHHVRGGLVALSRRRLLRMTGAAGVAGGLGSAALAQGDDGGRYPAAQPRRDPPREYEDYTVHRVPEAYDSIQAAVEVAEPRDLVLVGPGVYREAVSVTDTPQLTIRGTDRNEVILDGEFRREDGVLATVDDVVVENMTARNYQRNGFFWSSVAGWRGSYLTAHNNRVYGIYNIDSTHGRYEDCYASGHTDSGFYIGQCKPCYARIETVRSEHNAIGYSGTNAGGYLTVANSVWRHNKAGIVPNTLDSEADPPQDAARIEGNLVEHNSNDGAPDAAFGYATSGVGISVAGGINNEVFDNEVRGHANYGIAVLPMIDDNLYRPRNNLVRGNTVSESGRVDLALGAPQAGGNRFVDNDASSSRPGGLTGGLRLLGGDPAVTATLLEQYLQLENGDAPMGDWREAPEPPFDELESMPNPERAPREAVRR
jgi:hypothetical protein